MIGGYKAVRVGGGEYESWRRGPEWEEVGIGRAGDRGRELMRYRSRS